MFFLLSLYMQEILGFSALKTGVGYLAVALTAILASGAAQALTTKIGVKPVLTVGLALIGGGLIYFTQISVTGSYVSDLLAGFLMVGVGLGFSFVPVSIAALSGIEPQEAGLASGLINTSQQIGGALGVAILTTVFTTRSTNLIESGTDQPQAFVSGFSLAFWVAAAFAGISILATLFALRRSDLEQTAPAGAVVG
jgi:MFS family permease